MEALTGSGNFVGWELASALDIVKRLAFADNGRAPLQGFGVVLARKRVPGLDMASVL